MFVDVSLYDVFRNHFAFNGFTPPYIGLIQLPVQNSTRLKETEPANANVAPAFDLVLITLLE